MVANVAGNDGAANDHHTHTHSRWLEVVARWSRKRDLGRSQIPRFDHIWAKIANTDESRRAVDRRSVSVSTLRHCRLSDHSTAVSHRQSDPPTHRCPLHCSLFGGIIIDKTQSRRGKWRPVLQQHSSCMLHVYTLAPITTQARNGHLSDQTATEPVVEVMVATSTTPPHRCRGALPGI